jgi:DNA-binding CsgD family transcriptional regulator
VSEGLGVTKKTGRTHLKRNLRKVGARSHADLMRVVLRVGATFVNGDAVPHLGDTCTK